MKLILATWLLASLPVALPLRADGPAVLTGNAIGVQETQIAIEDTSSLRERAILQQETIKSLTDSLAVSNSEAEIFKREASDLRLKMETLGIAEITEPNSLSDKLLAAVRDLRVAAKEIKQLRQQIVSLSDAALTVANAAQSVDPEARAQLERELRSASEMLGATSRGAETEAVGSSLTDGMVVDVKPELSLVVANVGETHGVKIGMPFRVLREGKTIANVRVVDVRDRISGAVVNELNNVTDSVRVGDRLRVDAK